jgi:uncharacterized protein (DUF1697 family)
MQFVALLRGINVGGNALIKMADLKQVFEDLGFDEVSTYINSGNVIFSTDQDYNDTLVSKIESALEKRFDLPLKVVIRSQEQIQNVLNNVPASWKDSSDIRSYIAFVKEPVTPQEVADTIKINPEYDEIKIGDGVVYMTTKLDGLTKSGFSKLVGTKHYKDITIRNLNTTQKISGLMTDD